MEGTECNALIVHNVNTKYTFFSHEKIVTTPDGQILVLHYPNLATLYLLIAVSSTWLE